MSKLSLKALYIAKTQIGIKETIGKQNEGPEVNKYLASVGLDPGYSWCMAFIYWCYDSAAKELVVPNPLFKTGGVLNQFNKRPKNKVKSPIVGDIMILNFGHGTGHTGIVVSINGDEIVCIEGNSNSDGSRNGNAVVLHRRLVSKAYGFLRF